MTFAPNDRKNEKVMPQSEMPQNGSTSFIRWLLPDLPHVHRRLRLYDGMVARMFETSVRDDQPPTAEHAVEEDDAERPR